MNKKLLILGGSGLVGSKFIELHNDQFAIKSPDLYQVDILKKADVRAEVLKTNPDVILNFAAFTNVDSAEEEKGNKQGLAYKLNVLAVKDLVAICQEFGKKLIHFSTDYVFDGNKNESPYSEDDTPNPIDWYGETKYEGEQEILNSQAKSIIVRISMPYSSFYQEKKDFARAFLEKLELNEALSAVEDQNVTPILVDNIARALALLIEQDKVGIYHLAPTDWTTPYLFAQALSVQFGIDPDLVKPIDFAQFNQDRVAKRPKYCWLSSDKFQKEVDAAALKTIKESIEVFYQQRVLLESK